MIKNVNKPKKMAPGAAGVLSLTKVQGSKPALKKGNSLPAVRYYRKNMKTC